MDYMWLAPALVLGYALVGGLVFVGLAWMPTPPCTHREKCVARLIAALVWPVIVPTLGFRALVWVVRRAARGSR